MHRFSFRCFALALGITATLGSARAVPSLPSHVDYWTGLGVTPTPGAPAAFKQGGLCAPTASSPVGCLAVPSGASEPGLTNGEIVLNPTALASGDSNYQLDINISDLSTISNTVGSYWEVTLNGKYLGETPVVAVGGPIPGSTGDIKVILNDGMAPGTYDLGIVNGYLANTASNLVRFPGGEFALTVTETDLPEPASLAILAAGLGVMGLVRRSRAGV